MMLRGYRTGDLPLLSGPWLSGELLGLPLPHWPDLAAHTTVDPPEDHTAELLVAPGTAFVRYSGIDWVHRRARLEIGLQPGAADALKPLVEAAVAYGFQGLNLHRLHGWITPAAGSPTAVLDGAGFRPEAVLPSGNWFDGRTVERQIWGAVRHD